MIAYFDMWNAPKNHMITKILWQKSEWVTLKLKNSMKCMKIDLDYLQLENLHSSNERCLIKREKPENPFFFKSSSSKQQLDVWTCPPGISMSDIDNIETASKSKTEVKVDMFLPAPFYYDSITISYCNEWLYLNLIQHLNLDTSLVRTFVETNKYLTSK